MADRRTIGSTLEQVLAAIRGHRFRYSDEIDLQDGIAAVLEETGLEVQREVILDERDRIDILVGDIGIEVKVAGDADSALRQLERYSRHAEVAHLVLVTSQWQRLPAKAGDKPLTTVSLAVGAL